MSHYYVVVTSEPVTLTKTFSVCTEFQLTASTMAAEQPVILREFDRYDDAETYRSFVEKNPPWGRVADLPTGTEVRVYPQRTAREPEWGRRPFDARVVGYDIFHSKYRLNRYPQGRADGMIYHHVLWAFPSEVEPVDETPGDASKSPWGWRFS